LFPVSGIPGVPDRPSRGGAGSSRDFFHTFSYWSGPVGSPLSFNSIVVASPEQVSCPLGDESAILNLKNSVYYGVDPVGTRVWNLLKQPRKVAELRDAIVDEYEVDEDRCGRDVLELLEKMRGEGLIEVREAVAR
jgi:hypothetical protein